MKFENKRFILYGEYRLKQDLEYIFEGLHIEKIINENNYKDVLNENLDNIIILICDKNLDEIINKFQSIGLEYKKHFFIARDFFYDLLNLFPNTGDRKLVVWGTGKASEAIINLIDFDFEYYIDNDISKDGKIINGKCVKYSKNIDNWDDKFIIVASSYYNEIKENLIDVGLKENDDFIYYKQLALFKEMFDKFIYSTDTKKINCTRPFSYCTASTNGNVNLCCFNSLYPVGNIKFESFQNIWDSVYARMIRRSVINKTFCYCDSECYSWYIDEFNKTEMGKYPDYVAVEIDDTCNLMCGQCRNEIIIAKGNKYKNIDYIADKVINDILPNVKHLQLASNGEVFFSPAYKKILQSDNMKNLEDLCILSNGILFNRENWEIIKSHNINHLELWFSIDAATKETYEKLRRGGKFDILVKNLEFAGELRKNNEVDVFGILFVIQKENYKEMLQFVELGERINADCISFSRIRNCLGYSEKEFEEISMYDKNGKAKPELQEILSNPMFKNPKIRRTLSILN